LGAAHRIGPLAPLSTCAKAYRRYTNSLYWSKRAARSPVSRRASPSARRRRGASIFCFAEPDLQRRGGGSQGTNAPSHASPTVTRLAGRCWGGRRTPSWSTGCAPAPQKEPKTRCSQNTEMHSRLFPPPASPPKKHTQRQPHVQAAPTHQRDSDAPLGRACAAARNRSGGGTRHLIVGQNHSKKSRESL
jgi:hypothetical protein